MSASEQALAAALYRSHAMQLRRYLARFTGDAMLAEDLTHEAFVRLLERPPHSAPAVWLFRVATNLARDAARSGHRRSVLLAAAGDNVAHGDPPAAPDTCLERGEVRARVQQALLALSPKERAALLMSQEGFRQWEIAEAVGTTTKSVGNLIARALRKLERSLPRLQEEP